MDSLSKGKIMKDEIGQISSTSREEEGPEMTAVAVATGLTTDMPLSFPKIFKKITGLAVPMALSFTFSFEVFLSVLLLNYLSQSSEESAAATLVSVLMNTTNVLAMSPLFAVAIYLSGKLGELRELNNSDQLDRDSLNAKKEIISSTNANSLLIAALVTPPAMLALFFSKDILVSVFHQNPDVAASAQDFLRMYSLAVPGLMARMSLEQIMFSFGKTRPAMWMGLASLAIGGAISLMLGLGPKIGSIVMPRLGASGVAIGFVVEAYLTALSYGLYVGLSKTCREFQFFKSMPSRIKNNFNQLKDILKIGGSISFTVAIELAMTLAIGILSGLISTTAQSAMSYNMQFVYFEFIALAAFSFSCAQELSRELGAGKYLGSQTLGRYGLATTMLWLSPIPILFAAYPEALTAISGGASSAVSDMLKTLVPIMSVGIIIDAVRYNLLQQLRALNDLLVPNAIALGGMSLGIGLAAFLGLKTSMGVDGVATGFAVGVGVAAIGLWLRWMDRLDINKLDPRNTNIHSQERDNSRSSLCTFFSRHSEAAQASRRTSATNLLLSVQSEIN
jgi:Na+-driven multidrug efflux pump